jgi:hypothetical protein
MAAPSDFGLYDFVWTALFLPVALEPLTFPLRAGAFPAVFFRIISLQR